MGKSHSLLLFKTIGIYVWRIGMGNKKIEDIVTQMVLPIIDRMLFELVDVEYVKEQNNWYLRIYIDKQGGITLDDCQAVSEELSDELDKVDPIKQRYILEVSSPGLERPLKKDRDFERYKGETIEIKLFGPIDGKKIFEGELLGLVNNSVAIKLENGKIMQFNKNEIALAKRTIKF